MQRFLFKGLLFFMILFGCLLILRPSAKKSDYIAAIIDKHAEAEKIKTPKIIFAGGSNLAFGINSKEIEQQFSVPVINLGLQKDLGLSFMLNEVKDVVRPNDIVFLCIEYYMPVRGNYELEELAGFFYPECRNYYERNYIKDIKHYLDEKHSGFKALFSGNWKDGFNSPSSLNEKQDSIYSRETFNKYGDQVSHLEMKAPKNLSFTEIFNYRRWEGIEELNKFYNYSKLKGFSVYFLFPPYAQSQFQKNYLAIKKLEFDLKKSLKIPVLNKPEDFEFNDSLFFDTIYHLNKEGREKRTKESIKIFSKNKDFQNHLKSALSLTQQYKVKENFKYSTN